MNKFKYILLLSLFMGLSYVSQAQSRDYKSMSKEELINAKKEAIAAENYDLAQEINDELSSRKSIEEFRAEFTKQREEALANEDYTAAASLKIKLAKLDRIAQIDEKIKAAVSEDDFETASKLKEEKNTLLAEISGAKEEESKITDVDGNAPPKIVPGKATLRYLTINTNMSSWTSEFPATVESVYRFNLGLEYTYPLVKDLGLIAGWGWHFNMFGYNLPITSISSQDVQFYGANLFGSAGYQLEATQRLTFQALLKAGPTWGYFYSSGYSIGPDFIDGTETNEFDFTGWFSINGMLFLDDMQNYGIKAGLDIGFSGGTSFVLGFTMRGRQIKKS